MFVRKGVHRGTWHQDTLGSRLMRTLLSFHLTCDPTKRRAELLTDHHLVVSWMLW